MDTDNKAELYRQVHHIREVFVPYDRTEAVQADMTTIHHRENVGSEGGVLTLIGDSRSGKTKILRDYKNQHLDVPRGNIKPNGEFADRKEVVILRVPDTNIKNFLERLYAVLCNLTISQVDGAGRSRFNIQDSIIEVAKEVGLKLVLLEEAHQGFDNKKTSVAKTMAGVLKDLTNESMFSLVISGTSDANRLLDASPELAGRVLFEHELLPFDWSNPNDRETVQSIFAGLDEHLKDNVFGRLSGLSKPDFAKPLLRAGLGHIGHAARLLEVGALAAVDDMLEGRGNRLMPEHVAAAFSRSPLRRQFDEATSPFPLLTSAARTECHDDNPVTRLRGRTRRSNRDVAFKR